MPFSRKSRTMGPRHRKASGLQQADKEALIAISEQTPENLVLDSLAREEIKMIYPTHVQSAGANLKWYGLAGGGMGPYM